MLPEVEAVALGGSRASAHYDEKSDYDLYIYCIQTPEPNMRKGILEKYCQYMEIGNSFWELEDDCTLKDDVDIDILYRKMEEYFDIIFALNKLTHPGEKRMVQYAKEQAEILPADFEENLNCLFGNLFTDSDMVSHTLAAITSALERIVEPIT